MVTLSVNQGSDTKLTEFVANDKILSLLAKSTILENLYATFSFTASQYCQTFVLRLVAVLMNVIHFIYIV